jgi:Homeobox KN domain
MAYSSYDNTLPYQFIDPSLLSNLSPNGANLPSPDGSPNSVIFKHEYHYLGLENREQHGDVSNSPAASCYGSYLSDVSFSSVVVSSTSFPSPSETHFQVPQFALNDFCDGTSQIGTQSTTFSELSASALSKFKVDYEPDSSLGIFYTLLQICTNQILIVEPEYCPTMAYDPFQGPPSALSSAQTPLFISHQMQKCKSSYPSDRAISPVERNGTDILVTNEKRQRLQCFDEEEEAGSGPSWHAEKHLSRIENGTRDQTGMCAPLEEWYNLHRQSPYPTLDEKAQLARASGKTMKQVCNWFSNKRSRDKEGWFRVGLGQMELVILTHVLYSRRSHKQWSSYRIT